MILWIILLKFKLYYYFLYCRGGGIGRHASLRASATLAVQVQVLSQYHYKRRLTD